MFEWKSEYNTDISIIDEQHKVLVSLINELDDLVNEGFDKEAVAILFGKLKNYALYHFETEEALMEEHRYEEEDLQAHLLQHRQFEVEMSSISGDFSDVTVVDCEVVLTYLTNWLIYHICKVDRRLADFIHAQRADEADAIMLVNSYTYSENISVSGDTNEPLIIQARMHLSSADELLIELEQCLIAMNDYSSAVDAGLIGKEPVAVGTVYARGLDLIRLLQSSHLDLKSVLDILDDN